MDNGYNELTIARYGERGLSNYRSFFRWLVRPRYSLSIIDRLVVCDVIDKWPPPPMIGLGGRGLDLAHKRTSSVIPPPTKTSLLTVVWRKRHSTHPIYYLAAASLPIRWTAAVLRHPGSMTSYHKPDEKTLQGLKDAANKLRIHSIKATCASNSG